VFHAGQRRAATGEAARRRRHDAHRRGNTERARTEYCTESLTREGWSCGVVSVARTTSRKGWSGLGNDWNEHPRLAPARGVRDDHSDVRQYHSTQDERPTKPALHHDRGWYARYSNSHDEQVSTLANVDVVAVTRSSGGDRLNRIVAAVGSGAHSFTVGRRCDSRHSGGDQSRCLTRCPGSWAATMPAHRDRGD
jgi:hypothetical protein